MNNIIDQCYKKSVELLLRNSTKYGVLAASLSKRAEERNYLSIFGRDASICALGMFASSNKQLIKSAENSLRLLAKYQAQDGQIPNFVKPEKNQIDFWHFGCIDATLWWLIALHSYNKKFKSSKLSSALKRNKEKALNWLLCLEHPNFKLISQNEGSDWADIMPRSGYVLYTNTLWCWVKEMYNIKEKQETKNNFNYLFNSQIDPPRSVFKKDHRFARLIENSKQNHKDEILVSFVTRYNSGNEMDVYGNLLSIISKSVSHEKSKKILNIFLKKKANKPFPGKTVLRPIQENSLMWRPYMKDHGQNFPDQYHNGGVWPYIGGFWVVALARTSNKNLAKQELEKLALANKHGNWSFNEWFHGKTGRAMGKKGQSWNAGAYLFAYHYLKGDIKF